ncbi:MAG: hypothetical protein AAB350_03235 [Patescibacteria group bacterium]
MEFASVLPLIVILLVLAFVLIIKPGLTKDLSNHFASASSHKSGLFQKNNKGGARVEWLIIVVTVIAIILAISPVEAIVGALNGLWSAMNGEKLITERYANEAVWLLRLTLALLAAAGIFILVFQNRKKNSH